MINIWGAPDRSTAHATCVKKVYRYLKQKCGDRAYYERQLVTGYITDAFGYDAKSKIWYLCEIKVQPSDLQKAPKQILDTKFHFPKTQHYHTGDTIVPVIAVPARLAKDLIKTNEWDSLKNTCKIMKAAIWVIEQSGVQEVMGPKIKKHVTRNNPVIKAAKTKRPKTPKAKATKPKTARAKVTTSKKSPVKSSKAKSMKTKSTKRKISATRKSAPKRKR